MLACQRCGFLISYSMEDRAGIRIGRHPAVLTRQLRGFLISYSTEDSAGIQIGKHPAVLARQLRGFLIGYSTEDRAGILIGKHCCLAFDSSLPVLTLGNSFTCFIVIPRLIWAAG
jgi:hypothetical protein